MFCPFVWQRQKMMEQFDKTPTTELTTHKTLELRWGCLKRISSSLKKSQHFLCVTFHILFCWDMDNKNVTKGSTCPKKLASIPFVYLSANMYGHFLLSNFTKNIWAIYCTPSNPKISFVVSSTWALGPIKSRAGTIIPKLVCSMVLQV